MNSNGGQVGLWCVCICLWVGARVRACVACVRACVACVRAWRACVRALQRLGVGGMGTRGLREYESLTKQSPQATAAPWRSFQPSTLNKMMKSSRGCAPPLASSHLHAAGSKRRARGEARRERGEEEVVVVVRALAPSRSELNQ